MASIMEMGGDKANRARNKVRSAEASVTILKGAPMFYNMNGTSDGINVISAESLPAAKQGFFAGIAMQDITPGKIREGQVHGVCEYVRVITATRAATTDAWASYAAIAVGDILSVNTATGSVQAVSRTGAGSAGVFPLLAAAQTLASATTQASSVGSATFGASLFSIANLKAFIRSL